MRKNKWVFFFLCWLGMAVFFAQRWIFGPMIPYLMTDFHIDRVTAGSLVSAQMFGYTLTPFVAGYLSDRLGRRSVVLFGLFCLSFFTFLSGWTASHHQMYLTRFISGLTEPFFSMSLMAYFMELFPNHPAFFTTLMISGTSVGWFAGPLLSGWCLQTSGSWRQPFWILGGAGLLLFFIFLFYWYEEKSKKETAQEVSPQPARYSKTVFAATLITMSVIVFFDCIAEFGFSMWLPSFLKEERTFSIVQAGTIAGMWGIGQFFGRPLLGLLGDRTGYRHVGTLAAFFMGASLYFVVKSNTFPSFIFWQLAAGFIGGGLMGSLWTFTAVFYGKRKGTALGLVSNLGNTGSVVAPLVGGYLADRTSLETSLTIMALVPSTLCSLFFLSSFIWVRKNVRTRGKDREAVHGSQEPGMLR
jgi:ACS family hexuronate transporter-like MFS transporter